MTQIKFEEQSLSLGEHESVLECLERHGHRIASSCRSGVCQSCLMHGMDGDVPEIATRDLSPAQRAQGYFLSCVCKPTGPLSIARIDPARLQVAATVHAVVPLSERVVELQVRPERVIDFFAGQFFNLVLPDGTRRSYSAAAPPQADGQLSFHIGILPGGAFSTWVSQCAQPGDSLLLQGPLGKCCYVPSGDSAPLLLAGTGTGLAPLWGIARAALAAGHPGPIWLFHGALDASGLYLHEELKTLAAGHEGLHYQPCVLNAGSQDAETQVGDLQAHVLATLPKLTGYHVYLCGHPDFVKSMQRKVFLAGASLREIFADAFLPSRATAPTLSPPAP